MACGARINIKPVCMKCLTTFCEHLNGNRPLALTPREVTMMRALLAGAVNGRVPSWAEVAEGLKTKDGNPLSEGTMKTYACRLFTKLNLPDKAAASLWALKHRELFETPQLSEGAD